MPTSVKDLVRLYESSPKDPFSGVDIRADEPVTNPARFLHQPRATGQDHDGAISRRSPRRTFSPTTPDSTVTTFNVPSVGTVPSTTVNSVTPSFPSDLDGVPPSSHDIHWSQLRHTRFARTRNKHASQGEEDTERLVHHIYPPSSTHTNIPNKHNHTPVPATTLFGHKAAPLSLPYLDKYLSKLPRPPFVRPQIPDQPQPVMFKPMEQLEKLGKTLDDLEVNSKAAPFWRNRKTILGAAINVIIGVLVRGRSLPTLQHFNDPFTGLECFGTFL